MAVVTELEHMAEAELRVQAEGWQTDLLITQQERQAPTMISDQAPE